MQPPSLTIGIEEEYQIIDPETRELRSYITQFLELEEGKMILRERELKPELHQSIVEMGTPVCHNIQEARDEVMRMRSALGTLAKKRGLVIGSAGTHPFSSWTEQEITPFERYLGVVQDMQILARQLLIFGTHVHIGIEDREFLIDAMNVVRYMLPHVLALSTSSPFWQGHDTGLKSYRTVIFKNFPRTSIPDYYASWSDFRYYTDMLVKTGCISDTTKIWWDVRPNAKYPTLEFRICDACTKVEEVICVAAIFQALVLKLWKLRRDNMTFRIYRRALIEENKWRAARYGLDGQLIDFGKEQQLPARDLIRELIEWFIGDVIDELGSRKEVEYAYKILAEGSSADRQLRKYKETGDFKAVVDQIVTETMESCEH